MEELSRLHAIIAKLRAPDGCPWDREQTHATLKPYLLEETYETLDALDNNDTRELCSELGDLLLQIVLHSVIAEEQKEFTLQDVINGIAEKMVRRHPHVFADTQVGGKEDVWRNWEQIKKTEKNNSTAESILDSVPQNLPALLRAEKIQKKAARAGLDWTEVPPVLDKVREEISEFEENPSLEEFGDILFSLVNLARKLEMPAEDALRLATNKFAKRFRYIETKLQEAQKDFKDCSLAELDKYWNEAKSDSESR